MSQKRPIAKRYDVNEYEAQMLKIKSAQCGMKEAQYVRELITGCNPTEKPGKEFYDAMRDINRIGVNINQIAAVANATGAIDWEWLLQYTKDLSEKMMEIKRIVLQAKPVTKSYYEKLLYEQERARELGLPEPQYGDDLFPEDD